MHMKSVLGSTLLTTAMLVVGCAAGRHELVIEPVGPAPTTTAVAGATGTLKVFSALDAAAHFNDLPYQLHYSDYQILGADGSVLRMVRNHRAGALDGPAIVSLPAGSYRVVARANGYGTVTVPVVISTDQTTTVHLDGGSAWPSASKLAPRDAVRLPDGQLVGWRATGDDKAAVDRQVGRTANPLGGNATVMTP
jgi:hypothetical protein